MPLSPEPSVDSSATSKPVSAGKHRILIIEDNVDSAETLSRILTLMGHELYVAPDGVEGIEKFSEVKPDVVLLDIGLPNINGYDVAAGLRAQNPNVKLIALTGYGGDADRDRTLRAGFDDHLVKPVDFGVLEKLLLEARGK